jgi:hypothetical protein
MCRLARNPGSLNLLESYRHIQACIGKALPPNVNKIRVYTFSWYSVLKHHSSTRPKQKPGLNEVRESDETA